jgi:hypothetical protein
VMNRVSYHPEGAIELHVNNIPAARLTTFLFLFSKASNQGTLHCRFLIAMLSISD